MNKIIVCLCFTVCGIGMLEARQISITNKSDTTTFKTVEWHYGSLDVHNSNFDQIDDITIAPMSTANLTVPANKQINSRMIEVGGFTLSGPDSQFSGGAVVRTNLTKTSFVISKKDNRGIDCIARECQANLIIQ